MALVTGPGGPKQQKGYPGPWTKGEVVKMDFDYFDKKKITVIPSAMDYAEASSSPTAPGWRTCWAMPPSRPANPGAAAEPLRQKLLNAFDNGKIRVVPREDDQGNRLALRRISGCTITRPKR